MITEHVACRIEPRLFAFLAFDGARLAPAWPHGDRGSGQSAEQFGPGNCKNPSMVFRVFRAMPLLRGLVSVEAGFHYKQAAFEGPSPCRTPSKLAENPVNSCNLLKPCNLCNRCRFFAVLGGIGLWDSSVRSAMFIEHEPQNDIQAPSGAAWFELSVWRHGGL